MDIPLLVGANKMEGGIFVVFYGTSVADGLVFLKKLMIPLRQKSLLESAAFRSG